MSLSTCLFFFSLFGTFAVKNNLALIAHFLSSFVPFYEWMKTNPGSRTVSFHVFFQAAIRKELNEFKSSEMEVHEESRIYTRSGSNTMPINNSCQLFFEFIPQWHQYLISSLFPLEEFFFFFWNNLLMFFLSLHQVPSALAVHADQ